MIAQPDVTVPPNIRRLEDGRLVLVGGNHGVAQMFERGSSTVPEERIEIFRRNHRTRKQWADENGCTYSQWVFPDPIVLNAVTAGLGYRSIFERSMPSDARPNDLLYPIDHLFGRNDRLSMTDSHYTPVANMHLAADVAERTLHIDASKVLADLTSSMGPYREYVGDLGTQCTPKISEIRRSPMAHPQITSAANGVQAGNMGIMHLISSPKSVTPRTLMIFGDSFFRSLLTELARYWRKIVFCRTPFFHQEMMAAVKPDDVLCGLAERYFASTRPDTERPHFLAYPLMHGRSTAPDAMFATLWDEMIDANALALNR